MCTDFSYMEEQIYADAVSSLTDAGKASHEAALARGPGSICNDVVAAIENVIERPAEFSNMCSGTGAARRVVVSPKRLEDHGKVRFTVYGVLRRTFGYEGERVPLPPLAETLVKLAFPGPADAQFTWFRGSGRAAHDAETRVSSDKRVLSSSSGAGASASSASSAPVADAGDSPSKRARKT